MPKIPDCIATDDKEWETCMGRMGPKKLMLKRIGRGTTHSSTRQEKAIRRPRQGTQEEVQEMAAPS